MIENLWKEIQEKLQKEADGDISIRQAISEIRKQIKEDKGRIPDVLQEEDSIKDLILLLSAKDGKTRKNVALLCGDMEEQLFLEPLFEAYQKEEQRFVKSAYLIAMEKLDYRSILSVLKEKLSELSESEILPENKKHMEEELRILSDMIIGIEGISLHEFRGTKELSEIILLTNRDHSSVTALQIEDEYIESFTAGLRLKTNRLDKIFPIRTYQEMLFVVPGMKVLPAKPEDAAEKIEKADLLDFIQKRHKGKPPFYFRIEMKTRMSPDKKSSFVKALSAEIERKSNRNFINNKSNYEFEIRLIENKEGNYNTLLKLNSIVDNRFSYRKEFIAESIKPVNAALIVSLAKDYMKEDARVLDPFCGVGTMLIERQMQVKGNTSYGIDSLPEAIEKAKLNTEEAGQIIHYVNRDFFTFTHEYLFDEIFTNMPFVLGRKTEIEIKEIYKQFFEQAKIHLEMDGTIIMHSRNKDMVKQLAPKMGYKIVKQIVLNQREGAVIIILKMN